MFIHIKRTFIFLAALACLVIACLGIETRSSNHLGWLMALAGLAGCAAGLLHLGMTAFQTAAPGDTGSLRWLVYPALAITGLVPPLEFIYMAPSLPRSELVQDTSLILFAAGLPLILWSLGMAAHFRQAALPQRAGIGPLLLIPGWTGLGLIALGLCLGYASLIGLLLYLCCFPAGVLFYFRRNLTARLLRTQSKR